MKHMVMGMLGVAVLLSFLQAPCSFFTQNIKIYSLLLHTRVKPLVDSNRRDGAAVQGVGDAGAGVASDNCEQGVSASVAWRKHP